MEMSESLTHFEISGLHGYLDFKIDIKDNTLILVGENGSGKTSVLRILYQILAGNLLFLSQYRFNELNLCIGSKCVKIPGSVFRDSLSEKSDILKRRFPLSIRRKVKDLLERVRYGDVPPGELENLCRRYGLPEHYLYELLEEEETLFAEGRQKMLSKLKKDVDQLRKNFGSHVLYLPTYRRIEQDIDRIFRGLDVDEFRQMRRHHHRPVEESIELVEFGMRDVQEAIELTLEKLKDFSRDRLNTLTLGYLGDVVDEKYKTIDLRRIKKTEDSTINAVLGRIQESILSENQKNHLRETIDHVRRGRGNQQPSDYHKVICHYFLKLLEFQEELQEKETRITNFAEICTRYFSSNKNCTYDSATFTFSIQVSGANNNPQTLLISHLSSGEKQIMSLFSHLYLSEKKNFFVLIDEPELSLSVPWQRQFLVDIWNSNYCNGLVAVTHSPFMYENKLESYAHGLGEFRV